MMTGATGNTSDTELTALVSAPKDGADADADRFLIHARVLPSVLSYAQQSGCTTEQIDAQLAYLGLSGVRPDAYDSFIPLNRFGRLLQRFAKLLDDEAFGLCVADHTDTAALGVLGKAYVSAPDFATALGVVTHYMRLYADVSFASLSVGDERVEYSWAYSPMLVSRDFICDRSMRFFIKSMREVFGHDILPLEIHLQRTRPKNPAPFRAALATNIRFDARANRIALRRVDLDRANPKSDPHAFELALALAERMMGERRIPDDLSIRTREDIAVHLQDQGPDMNETARRLGMSPRTLQRRLEGLGTSFQALADDARKVLAKELLTQTLLPINEIAYRLGFANQANLTRAVKRWFDESPRTVRKSANS